MFNNPCSQAAMHSIVFVMIAAALGVSAQESVTANPGDEIRLFCPIATGPMTNWQYGEKVDRLVDVYISGEGLASSYKNGGRYSTVLNNSTNGLDLLITDVTKNDEGYYLCSSPESRSEPLPTLLRVVGQFSTSLFILAESNAAITLEFINCTSPPYIIHLAWDQKYSALVYNKGARSDQYKDGNFAVRQLEKGWALTINLPAFKGAGLQQRYGGTYTCIDNGGGGKKHSIDLMILETHKTATNVTKTPIGVTTITTFVRKTIIGGERHVLAWIAANCVNDTECLVNGSSGSFWCNMMFNLKDRMSIIELACMSWKIFDKTPLSTTTKRAFIIAGCLVGLFIIGLLIVWRCLMSRKKAKTPRL